MKGYMLDTTEFNALVDGALQPSDLAGRQLYVTHVQRDEIMQEMCTERRKKLLSAVELIAAKPVNTAAAMWGTSQWDKSDWTPSPEVVQAMLASLRRREAKRKKRPQNQERDVLIAPAAIAIGAILISGDKNLRAVTEHFGGRAIQRDQLSSEQ